VPERRLLCPSHMLCLAGGHYEQHVMGLPFLMQNAAERGSLDSVRLHSCRLERSSPLHRPVLCSRPVLCVACSCVGNLHRAKNVLRTHTYSCKRLLHHRKRVANVCTFP
jgi:hypothetical protein